MRVSCAVGKTRWKEKAMREQVGGLVDRGEGVN